MRIDDRPCRRSAGRAGSAARPPYRCVRARAGRRTAPRPNGSFQNTGHRAPRIAPGPAQASRRPDPGTCGQFALGVFLGQQPESGQHGQFSRPRSLRSAHRPLPVLDNATGRKVRRCPHRAACSAKRTDAQPPVTAGRRCTIIGAGEHPRPAGGSALFSARRRPAAGGTACSLKTISPGAGGQRAVTARRAQDSNSTQTGPQVSRLAG
ncbi:hypothetical protein ACRAWF_16065 [Streptomyces sp. L7]